MRGHGWKHIDEMSNAKELIVNVGDFGKLELKIIQGNLDY